MTEVVIVKQPSAESFLFRLTMLPKSCSICRSAMHKGSCHVGGPSGFSSYFLLLPERSSVVLSEGSWCSSSNITGCSCQAGKARCPRQGVSSRSSNIYKDVLEATTTYNLYQCVRCRPRIMKRLFRSNWKRCPFDPVDPGPSTNTD